MKIIKPDWENSILNVSATLSKANALHLPIGKDKVGAIKNELVLGYFSY